MTKYIFFSITVLVLLSALNCKKYPPVVPPDEPPPYQQSIFLSVTDRGMTEVYLKLSITDSLEPRRYVLMRNDAQVLSSSLLGNDTTIVDTTAQMHTGYTYRAFRVDNTKHKDSSNTVTTTTLDTTSHDYMWEVFTFGGASSSVLRDVTIINDTLIYACGEISKFDSSGQIESNIYNFITLTDNTTGKEKRAIVDFRGNNIIPPMDGMFSFSPTDIWMIGSLPVYGDGNNWIMYDVRTITQSSVSLSYAWGTNSTNMFFVGRSGSIAKFDGNSWQEQSSGTTVDLTDVWGTPDGSTVWACGYEYDFSSSVFLEYTEKSKKWETLWEKGTLSPFPFTIVSSIWGNHKLYVASGEQVYELSSIRTRLHSPWFGYKVNRIRGSGENDIVAVTTESAVWHFNGSNWKKIYTNPNITLTSLAVKNNLVAAVGYDRAFLPHAVVVIGTRE